MYTNFEGVARQKKRNFLVNIFQKMPKTPFSTFSFQNFSCGADILAKTESL